MTHVFDERGVQDFLAFNIDMTDFFLAQAKRTTDPVEKAELLELADKAAHEDLWHFEAVNRRGNTVEDFTAAESDPMQDSGSAERKARVEEYAQFYANPENAQNELTPTMYKRKDVEYA